MDENIKDSKIFVGNHNPIPADPRVIKVIGVGGGGNNAVDHMYEAKIKGVTFVNINTDRQALRNSCVEHKLEIGDGLGAGAKPEVAKKYAEESIEQINELFDDGTKMVFITAGMGGGTGTGAAPVVARVARERGLLTIGIVTIPFLFEGPKKIIKALDGADEMAKYVDALLVINNERLIDIYGDLDFMNAFGKADDTLTVAARSISEIITLSGPKTMNCDFNDVDTTLRNSGAAIISTGVGEGTNRLRSAIDNALKSPLLKSRDIEGSKKLLFVLTFNPDAEKKLKMSEMEDFRDFTQSMHDVEVIWGYSFDESLGDSVKVTVLAAGFDVTIVDEEDELRAQRGEKESGSRFPFGGWHPHTKPEPVAKTTQDDQTRIINEYGDKTRGMSYNDRGAYVVLAPHQLDDDEVCNALEQSPAYKRSKTDAEAIKAMGNASPVTDVPTSSHSISFN